MWSAVASSRRWTAVNQLIRSSSDMAEFREVFMKARHIAVITGAGVSVESGIPSIRGAEGRWRTWRTQLRTSFGTSLRQTFCPVRMCDSGGVCLVVVL
ncbi:hypothetical protein DNTS_033523 [Danionella cerebrum]|uniref:Uncharacterized protein n=1 Tax=Danionella cerebrum TaxID=2873325 RepID=A0A553NHY8_9TELE|nr:hypothetical protein DNTS_033523 [Danionella translucida]